MKIVAIKCSKRIFTSETQLFW